MDMHEIFKTIVNQFETCEKTRYFPDNLGAQMLLKVEEHLEAVKEVNDYLDPDRPGTMLRIAEELVDDMVVSLRMLKRM